MQEARRAEREARDDTPQGEDRRWGPRKVKQLLTRRRKDRPSTDSLLTPTEALELAPAAVAEALAEITARMPDEPLERIRGPEAELRMARLLLAQRAHERCAAPEVVITPPRIAILDRGVSCCAGCRFTYADAKARADGRCDTCDAGAEELRQVRYQLHGGLVLPDGSVQAAVLVVAKVCVACLTLLESAPSSSRRGAGTDDAAARAPPRPADVVARRRSLPPQRHALRASVDVWVERVCRELPDRRWWLALFEEQREVWRRAYEGLEPTPLDRAISQLVEDEAASRS